MTPPPPLRLLMVFEAVLRRGGARAAAAELNVSQPAVSQSLKQLEAHLGAVLLDRSTRPPTLTEAGQLLHRATTDGLGRIREAVEEIARLRQKAERAVTIACSVGLATYWLMPRLAQFYDARPDIAVNVRTTAHGAPPLAGGVDLALRYGDGRWDDGKVNLLFPERVEPVCHPRVAAALRSSPTWPKDATLIHVDVDDESWLSWPHYFRGAGRGGGARGLRFTNYVQATQAALAGQGVMLGWRSITGDLLRDGRLETFGAPALDVEAAYYVVAQKPPQKSEPCDAVLAWLMTQGGG